MIKTVGQYWFVCINNSAIINKCIIEDISDTTVTLRGVGFNKSRVCKLDSVKFITHCLQ